MGLESSARHDTVLAQWHIFSGSTMHNNKWINLFFGAVLCTLMVGTAEGQMNLESQKKAFIDCINLDIEGSSLRIWRICAEVLVDLKTAEALKDTEAEENKQQLKDLFIAKKEKLEPLGFQLPPNWWRGGGIWVDG